jgi:hypothetical protein
MSTINPKMMLQSSLVIMWIVSITCLSVIIHNSSTKSRFNYYTAIFGLILILITPVVLLTNFVKEADTDPGINVSLNKITIIFGNILLPLALLISLSQEYNIMNDSDLTKEEKEKIKISHDAAIALFVLSAIFYGVIGGFYYRGGEVVSKEIKKMFIQKNEK